MGQFLIKDIPRKPLRRRPSVVLDLLFSVIALHRSSRPPAVSQAAPCVYLALQIRCCIVGNLHSQYFPSVLYFDLKSICY